MITLVIIGVIAAITVPTLITKYQKEQTVTRLKKAYSALSQTTARAIADNGPIKTWEISTINNSENAKNFFHKYCAPYLSLAKPATSITEGNWSPEYYFLNGELNNYTSEYVRTYLADGTSLTFRNESSQTSKKLGILIDINGDKKPNKRGKDIFEYKYYIFTSTQQLNGKFLPSGFTYNRNELITDSYKWFCNKNKAGSFCAALIMKDGWRIADDYPW